MQSNGSSPTTPPTITADSIEWPMIRTQNQLRVTSETIQAGEHIYPAQGKKIGEIMKSMGIIDDKILSAVEKRHETKKVTDKPTGELLVYMGIIEQEVLIRSLCIQSGVPMVNLNEINIPYEFLKYVTNDDAREKQAIPVGAYHGTLYLAVSDPLNFQDQHFFSFSTGLKIKPVYAPKIQIVAGLNTLWKDPGREIWAG